MKKNYITISTKQQAKEMLDYIHQEDIIAYDTETNGLNVRRCVIIGFSVTNREGTGYYLPIFQWDTELENLVPYELEGTPTHEIAKFLVKQLVGKKLIMHNASFDCQVTKNDLGVDLLPSLWVDTMLLYHSINEEGVPKSNRPFGLKEIAIYHQEELGLNVEEEANKEQIELKESVKNNGGSVTKTNFEIYKADLSVLAKYAVADTDLTYRIAKLALPTLKEEGLWDFYFKDEVMPLYKEVTVPMEERGVRINIPRMKKVRKEISEHLVKLEQDIMGELIDIIPFKRWVLNTALKEFPPKRTGRFAQHLIKLNNLDLPLTKSGKFSTAKKGVEELPESNIKDFLLSGDPSLLDTKQIYEISLDLWKEANDGKLINIQSNKQLGEVVFDFMGVDPISYTDKGQAQFNKDTIVELSGKFPWMENLRVYNKLQKVISTYIDRFLDRQEEGRYYFYYKQHGTISGRYGSDAQQLPRPIDKDKEHPLIIKYVNEVRAFFIADEGRIFIDADYTSLEPHVFASVSNEELLQDIFLKGHDFYCTIAIMTEGLEGVSADKEASNYLGEVDKPKRQKAKAYCLDGDSILFTTEGHKKLKDIKVGDIVKSMSGFNKVQKTYKYQSNVVTVHTNRGSITCTPDHKFFVGGRWVMAKDLVEGDELLVDVDYNYTNPTKIQLPIKSNMSYRVGGGRPIGYLHLDAEWAYFCGAILGDGVISISQRHNTKGHGLKGYVGICGMESDRVVNHVSNFLLSLGFTTRILKEKLAKNKVDKVVTKVCTNSELSKIVYDTLGLGNWEDDGSYKNKNLEVPTYILNSDEKIKLAFLAGLLDTDGYVKNNNNMPHIAISSKDFRLINGIKLLLDSLDVLSSVKVEYNKLYEKNYHTVNLTRSGCKRLLSLGLNEYMVCPRKVKALESYSNYSSTYPTRIQPPQVKFVEECNKVIDVYDITVENDHNFFANGILVHNSLGIPYGMKSYALGKSLDIPTRQAGKLINQYLNAFPNLKKWMVDSELFVKENGYIKSQVGRIRHLTKVKYLHDKYGDQLMDYKFRQALSYDLGEEIVLNMYRDYKNGLNNAKNFQIQSLSASIVNRAAIAVTRYFKEHGIDGVVVAQIHDQLIFDVPEDRVDELMEVVAKLMAETTKIAIPLKAPPEKSYNWKEGH
jgi:DNA polymerase I-like protein with 3'-5' exonuclease and polymerase domains/intein/homing endonuclease